jgi:predicted DNA-binding transcriptional regulator YafY
VRELLRLGDQVVVLGPPSLRSELARTAERIAKLHESRASKREH